MDAVTYIKEAMRMRKSAGDDCENCLAKVERFCPVQLSNTVPYKMQGNEENAVSVVEKWAKDNPIKTRMTEFSKMFPDATIADDGMPDTDPCDINQKLLGWCSEDNCEKCRREFWLKEIEG